ncbi:hypothetical protein [Nocardia fusca]|uniref:hypothetical protein n=1 Tax=Nocardia fusca TaxID=941183 RepID=UPI0007A763E0|nr:hypothetical protein [Nocardia fusca]
MNHDTNPAPLRPGDSVRLRTSGELLTVTELAGSTDRPTIVCRDDVPGSSLRFCQPSDLEPVELDGPTELDLIRAFADRDLAADRAAQLRAQREIAEAKAQNYAEGVTRRVIDAIEASGTPVFDLLEGTGISIHRLAQVCDGADCFTVSEVCVLTLAAGVGIRDMFGPVDAAEVTR